MKIKRRCFVRVISFSLALVLALGGFLIKECAYKNKLKQRIELSYKQSLSEFSSLLTDINNDLKKQFYSTSDRMLNLLSSNIYKNTACAKECLERLPVSPDKSENIYKFLSTAGDFSKAVAVSENVQIAQKNKTQLKKLIEFSEKLTSEISDVASSFEDSEKFSDDVDNIMNELSNETEFFSATEDVAQISESVPTLIYDGPFSDHVISSKAKLLENKPKLTKDAALKRAKFFTDEDDLKYIGDENSRTESYIFADDDTTCAITKMGGYCLYIAKETDAENTKVSMSAAIENAKKYLNKTLGLQFKESYYIVNENVATINFAFFENGVTFYSDLIKVGVDLEDGDIVSLEARGFVMNHHNREKYTYKHTKSQAEKTINSELKIKTVNKAVALDDAQNEIYCFEFHCKTETGEDIIVYVKDKDLSEQDIFMIIHTDGGDLVL